MRRDPVRTLALGIAFAVALLVAGGIALDLAGALDPTGWAAIALVLLGGLAIARDPARHAVPVVVALVGIGLAIGAVALARESARDEERATRFTQLWMVPAGPGRSAEVGVRNEEGVRVAFRLEVYAPGSEGGTPLVAQTIVLDPGRSWSRRLAIPATPLPERVNAELFRAGRAGTYRSAHVWTAPGG